MQISQKQISSQKQSNNNCFNSKLPQKQIVLSLNQQQSQTFNLNDNQQFQLYVTKIIPKINSPHASNHHNYNQLNCQKDVFQITQNPDGNVNIQMQYIIKSDKQQQKLQSKNKKCFTFSDVLNSDIKNSQIFCKHIKELVRSAFQGKNGCVFAYGQTGSGKSSLIFKKQNIQQKLSQRSLLQQSINEIQNIYKTLPTQKKQKLFINLSCFQIYNERIIDLMSNTLETQNKLVFDVSLKSNLKIRQNKTQGIYIQDLTIATIDKVTIQSYTQKYELQTLLKKYFQNSIRRKQIYQTNMSQHSSRSSVIYNIQISYLMDENTNKIGKLTYVDLAGSQKSIKTGSNLQLTEMANIGKSLNTFIRVLEAISSQNKFVPYRDSILTRCLQNQFKGSCRNIIFFCLKADSENQEENLNTLRAANHLKKQHVIKIHPNYIVKKKEQEDIPKKKQTQN